MHRIEEILATDKQVTLSDKALTALTLRRQQQIQRKQWVEGQ
jgi:hypothetical protein